MCLIKLSHFWPLFLQIIFCSNLSFISSLGIQLRYLRCFHICSQSPWTLFLSRFFFLCFSNWINATDLWSCSLTLSSQLSSISWSIQWIFFRYFSFLSNFLNIFYYSTDFLFWLLEALFSFTSLITRAALIFVRSSLHWSSIC